MQSGRSALAFLLAALLSLAASPPAHAFASWQDDANSLELRGLLRGSALNLTNPGDPTFYNKRNVNAAAASGRLMLDAGIGSHLSIEAHAEQSYVPLDLQTGGSNLVPLRDVERSALLDQSFAARRAHLLLDRLNVQYDAGPLKLKAGRQPVNLASTFYFTPNDFFAPFAAQTFYRSYKPGVDALRADIRLADLSQLSLIGVLGYQTNTLSDSGWSRNVDTARNSYLARGSRIFGDIEFALLGGTVKKDVIAGGDFQGDLFNWLGIRGEGHLNVPKQAGLKRRIELAVGLEHRWESSLTLRLEQFHHGGGTNNSAAYSPTRAGQGLYMARNYTALGANYEFTPLLTGDMTVLHNWLDSSSLFAVYALYSLSNESELALSGTLASGRRPVAATIRSEFGLYGNSLSCEVRSYF